MRRLLAILLFLTGAALAQQGNTITIPGAGAASGTCGPLMFWINLSNGDAYDCPTAGWNKIAGSGGGFTAGGDLSGTSSSQTVVGIEGGAIPASATVVGTNSSSQPVAATTTGSGAVVLANTPTLITPVLGAATGTSLTLTDTAANTDLSTSNTTPTVTGASTTVALSTGTPPSNLSGNSWVYTLAATESGAGSNAWAGATVTLSGWTGGATGNNCAGGCPITASTTTTVTITNATGSTTNTGTPVMISTAVVSSPLAKVCGTVNSGTAGTLNSIPDCWSLQNVPAAVGPNPITNLTVAHSGSSGAGAFTIATGIAGINILAGNYTAAAAQGLLITGRALYLAPASGVAEITNSAATGLTRLDLGLATSSGPALCVSGTTITVCGGDGTAVGTLSSPNYSSGGTAGISSSGTLCTATFTTVSGLVTACTAASDPRLKNYKPTQHGLADVLRLHPIEWTYNALAHRTYPNLPENLQIGFNAKNVHEVIPEATGSDDKGYLTLPQGDRPIVAALVNAIQQQQKEIRQLRQEIHALKAPSRR